MKMFLLLIGLAILISACSVSNSTVEGREYCTGQQAEFCAAVFDPVCGDDRQTYSNGCVACAQGVEYYDLSACE